MKQRSKWLGVGLAVASLAVVTTTGYAGTNFWDLNNSSVTNELIIRGTGPDGGGWKQEANGNGFIQITAAVDSQSGAILFPDADDGLVVKAFTFEAKIKLGDGENPPADGFSLNYASSTDPVVTSMLAGNNATGWAGSADNGGTETNLPEEGTQTGLGIGFDTWGFPGGYNGADNRDLRGISIRVNGTQVAQIAMPTLLVTGTGDPNDPTSLETGFPDEAAGNTGTNLLWAPLRVTLDELGVINVFWKGSQVLSNYQSEFFPIPGRIVFGGRTGGNNAIQWVDDIALGTIPSTTFLISGLIGNAEGFTVTVNDAAGSQLVPSTIELSLNNEVLPSTSYTVSKSGNVSSITYSELPNFFAAGSTNQVSISAEDNNGVTASLSRSFVVRPYMQLDPAWIAPASDYNTSDPGFIGNIHQIGQARGPGDANSVWSAMRHLAGGYLDAAGTPLPNLVDPIGGTDANGNFEFPDGVNYVDPWINFGQDANATTPAEAGRFTSALNPLYTDYPIPGIPGTTLSTDNIVAQFWTYLNLTGPNLYTFVFNSDDGFRVSFGPDTRSAVFTAPGGASTLANAGQYNGGKGSSDIQFDVAVPAGASGVYLTRALWWEGGGGASAEFFSLLDGGSFALVGDTAAGGIAAYKPSGASVPGLAADIVSVAPWPGQTGIRPDSQIQIILADGAGATVDGNSIAVEVNGVEFAKTVTKVGDKTRVTASPAVLLDGGVANNVEVTWTAGGNTRTNTWTFTTLPYTALPEWLARPLGSGTNPGFTARVHQLGTLDGAPSTIGNRWHIRDQQLAGLFGPSTATVAANADQVLSLVNFNGDSPLANIANFTGDVAIPGIPGTKASRNTDDIAMEIVTYIEFPATGYYQMGVYSDDGFQVIAREKLNRLPGLKIVSPASLFASQNNYVGAISRGGTQGRYVAAPLPVTAVEGKIVAAVPAIADTALQNAAEIAGNIALIDRGTVGFGVKIANAASAGAIGVIMVDSNTDGRLPIEMGGTETSTLPAVMVSNADGATLKTAITSGDVVVSIGADTIPSLGFFNDGRGWDDGDGPTLFGFQITKPGVYPFRMVWFEGGGGANCEWFLQSASGTRVLINDPANAAVGLTAFRNAPAVVEPTEATFNPPILANGQVTLSWDGAGTLQESTDLINWSASPSQANPQNVDPTGNVKAYRILVSPGP